MVAHANLSEKTSKDGDASIVVPFLKWAGGKRWLVDRCGDLFPQKFNRYIEPFLGGGAVFFWLKPKKAIISDTNASLIHTYCAIRDDWEAVRSALSRHHKKHSENHYYEERSRKRRSVAEKAAQFIYLNRSCWNGLYRVNLSGMFNVPIGTKNKILMETDNFSEISGMLKDVKISCSDFVDTIKEAKDGDFLYIDPPYTVNHNFNGFLKYNEKIFNWKDQVRLRDSVALAIARGAKVIVSNADHKSVRDLYAGIGIHKSVDRVSVIAGNPKKRGAVRELLVLSC